MADEPNSASDRDEVTGTPPGRSASDKERTRQQSRQVSGREASRTVGTGRKAPGSGRPARSGPGKGGGGTKTGASPSRKGTNGRPTDRAAVAKGGVRTAPAKGSGAGRGRPDVRRRPPTAAARRSPTTLFTWGAVALVLVVVIALVVWKVAGGGSSSSKADTTLPDSVASDIATVPSSVFDTVGTNSSVQAVTPPTVIHGQPPLTFSVNGTKLPGIFFFGAEYCPYCAAERWPLAVTLSRFAGANGGFKGLKATESSTSDVFAGTQTISFYKATYSSPYLAFQHVEAQSNQPASNGSGYQTLQNPTAAQVDLVRKYDTAKYINALSSTNGSGSIPFIDFGNRALVAGASYSPALLAGLSRDQIAGNLHDPNNAVTQAIIATSNYMSASICASTNQQPASVCTSKGVTEAAKAMKLSS